MFETFTIHMNIMHYHLRAKYFQRDSIKRNALFLSYSLAAESDTSPTSYLRFPSAGYVSCRVDQLL